MNPTIARFIAAAERIDVALENNPAIESEINDVIRGALAVCGVASILFAFLLRP